jgi:hypothetical protein
MRKEFKNKMSLHRNKDETNVDLLLFLQLFLLAYVSAIVDISMVVLEKKFERQKPRMIYHQTLTSMLL